MTFAVRIERIGPEFSRWQALLDLILMSFASMHDRIEPPSSALSLTVESLARKAGDEVGFVACMANELVGCAFLSERDDHFYLGKLAVAPGRQGSGIGRKLLQAAEDHARVNGKPILELQTRVELVENHMAFARMGFRETNRTAHAGFDRPTSLTMRKVLA